MSSAAQALRARVGGMAYLPKWVLLASLIGVIAGLGAVVFYEALRLSTQLFLGLLAGYHVPTPAGEGNAAGSAHYARAWAIPLVVVLGALLSGWLVFTFAPEAEGHGTDAAIDAVHRDPRGIRLRAVVVKIIASALTIGSGGSGGREGPTAQISAGFGSLLARLLDLSPEDGRVAVSVGIGSGIGAIFSAPLGGAVLAADIVYRDDFEFEALLPGLLASIIAYAIFGALLGYQPLFAIPGGYRFDQPLQLVWFALIGLLAGGVGLLYARSFYGFVALSRRLPCSRKLRPALGGLLVGLLALGLPEVLGTGYGWVQKGLGTELIHTPLLIILALPLARILATSLSIGSGGSGGVFGPGMVIGAFTGLAVWRLLEPFAPAVGHDPAPFVIVGMMAVFGGISRAPVAVMLMVAQMTGSITLLGPAMVAVAISWFIVKRADDSIYRSQLHTRAEQPELTG
jgi:H+/Cl- antiporter ClcA